MKPKAVFFLYLVLVSLSFPFHNSFAGEPEAQTEHGGAAEEGVAPAASGGGTAIPADSGGATTPPATAPTATSPAAPSSPVASQPAVSASATTSSEGSSQIASVIPRVDVTGPGNTGAANIHIPIEVPPGRNGIAPNIALTYNSNKGNGWIGVGWDLEVGAIQRSTKYGVTYGANDFVFIKDGVSVELVPRGDWGVDCFGAKIEGAFSKFCKVCPSDQFMIPRI